MHVVEAMVDPQDLDHALAKRPQTRAARMTRIADAASRGEGGYP
ncbi:hypothetical protein [Demequina sp. SO4-18]